LNERSFILPLPTKSSIGFLDWQVVDAGEAEFHVAKFIEFPILVAVGAKPLAGVVVIFILETHGDAIAVECPRGFLEAIIQFLVPLAAEKFNDLCAAMNEFRAVAPLSEPCHS